MPDVVERLWLLSDAPEHSKERIVPSGTIERVINLHEDELLIFTIPRNRSDATVFRERPFPGAFVIVTREHVSVTGVHFKPGGAFVESSGYGVDIGSDIFCHKDEDELEKVRKK